MLHRIRDTERRQICAALEAANTNNWARVASEIDYERNQIYFWFLIKDESLLDDAVTKAIKIIHRFAAQREGPQFVAGFIELTDRHQIDWETIHDETLRKGRLDRPSGSRPWRTDREEFSVFDRPDYIVLPADEPI